MTEGFMIKARTVSAAMTAGQRARFDRDGYLVIPGALTASEVASYAAALDRAYAGEQEAGRTVPGGPMHLLSAVLHCPQAAGLIAHLRALPLVWSVLGWNIHIYHSHLDVHPPVRPAGARYRFEWHQDGGRQNREIETSPRPRMSVKLVYWLSDVSAPGRGNLTVVPGSHTRNWISGPPRRDVPWPEPDGAVPVLARPGDAVLFDRRLWHARSTNFSEITRKAIFFGYTYRWVAIRDDVTGLRASRLAGRLTPVQRQLLGLLDGDDGDHAWGHYPGRTPLYTELRDQGQLDPGWPPLRP